MQRRIITSCLRERLLFQRTNAKWPLAGVSTFENLTTTAPRSFFSSVYWENSSDKYVRVDLQAADIDMRSPRTTQRSYL
ncbi:hypothetical protein M404DRAFT_271659 [Pisolithus tinctorius Marx 270]|uniref:Uncharacterized protein n=1 Tax=Pisolithus tinctorius Marx 270 TaxID=870435 RepID=A0A0C3PLF1_PISTI|nr:hypothetical protein M404DRAFT_271659 [Pisolithus tinctorius Marx 270]